MDGVSGNSVSPFGTGEIPVAYHHDESRRLLFYGFNLEFAAYVLLGVLGVVGLLTAICRSFFRQCDRMFDEQVASSRYTAPSIQDSPSNRNLDDFRYTFPPVVSTAPPGLPVPTAPLEPPLSTASPEPPLSTAPIGNPSGQSDSAICIHDLKERYGKAFERNQRQIALLLPHVLEEQTGGETFHHFTCHDNDSIGIALESTRSVRETVSVAPQGRVANKKESYLVHPSTADIVGGTCVICLDEMRVGETVVWSETESCPHMYHKDCLVSFLAHNCEQQTNLPPSKRMDDYNPCPACRQQFVTL